jgi:bacteriocin-like protein
MDRFYIIFSMKGTGTIWLLNNVTDDRQKQAETGEELSEQELKQVVGGAFDAFLQLQGTSEPEEKP